MRRSDTLSNDRSCRDEYGPCYSARSSSSAGSSLPAMVPAVRSRMASMTQAGTRTRASWIAQATSLRPSSGSWESSIRPRETGRGSPPPGPGGSTSLAARNTACRRSAPAASRALGSASDTTTGSHEDASAHAGDPSGHADERRTGRYVLTFVSWCGRSRFAMRPGTSLGRRQKCPRWFTTLCSVLRRCGQETIWCGGGLTAQPVGGSAFRTLPLRSVAISLRRSGPVGDLCVPGSSRARLRPGVQLGRVPGHVGGPRPRVAPRAGTRIGGSRETPSGLDISHSPHRTCWDAPNTPSPCGSQELCVCGDVEPSCSGVSGPPAVSWCRTSGCTVNPAGPVLRSSHSNRAGPASLGGRARAFALMARCIRIVAPTWFEDSGLSALSEASGPGRG